MNANSRKNKIECELYKLVIRQLKFGIPTEAIVFTVTLSVIWTQLDKSVLLPWWIISIVFCLMRFVAYLHLSQAIKLDQLNPTRTYQILCGIALGSGLCWGFLGYVFMSYESFSQQTFIIMILLGALSVGNLIYSPTKYLYMLFLLPAYVPHIIWLMTHQETTYLVLGSLAILYLSLMVITSYYYQQFIEAANTT